MTTLEQIPGDPITIGAGARRMGELSAAFSEAAQTLREIALTEVFISEAIDEVRLESFYAADATKSMSIRYGGTSEALIEYAAVLESSQAKARRAIQAYDEAHHDELRHRRMEDDYNEMAQKSSGKDQEDALALAAERRRLADQAHVEAGVALRIYERAIEEHEAAAQVAYAKVGDAIDDSHLNDSFWDDVNGVLKNVQDWCQEKLAPIFELIRDIAAKMSEVCGWISLGLTLLSLIPFLAPFTAPLAALFGTIALVASGVAFAMNLALFAMGSATFGQLAMSGLDLALKVLTKGTVKSTAVSDKYIPTLTKAANLPANAVGDLYRSGLRTISSEAFGTEGGSGAERAVTTVLDFAFKRDLKSDVNMGLDVMDIADFSLDLSSYNAADPLGGPLWTRPDSIQIPQLDPATFGSQDFGVDRMGTIGSAVDSGDYRIQCVVGATR